MRDKEKRERGEREKWETKSSVENEERERIGDKEK